MNIPSGSDLMPDRRSAVFEYLKDTEGTPLIVFDNLEQIVHMRDCGKAVERIVRSLPEQFRVLFISQHLLDSFPGLDELRWVNHLPLDALSKSDSEILIRSRFSRQSWLPISTSLVDHIYTRSGGIPLLIEWLVEIVLANPDGAQQLDKLGNSSPERFETSIRKILHGLDEPTRNVWDCLLVATLHGYRLTPEAVDSLSRSEGTNRALSQLHSFPLIANRDGYIRVVEALTMLYQQLTPHAKEEPLLERIAAYYLGIVSVRLRLRLESYENTDVYRAFLRDKDNFVLAVEYYIDRARDDNNPLAYRNRLCLYQFATGLSWFLWVHGLIGERIRLLTAAIELAVRHGEEPEKCLANINDVAWTHYHLGDITSAETLLGYLELDMLQIVRKSNLRYKAMIDRLRANVLIGHGEKDDRIPELLNDAAAIFEAVGEHRRVASVRSELGLYHYSRGEYAEALELYSEALQRSQRIGEKHSLPVYHWRLGEALIALFQERGDPELLRLAIEHLEDGLSASLNFRRQSEAHVRVCLAKAYFLAGRMLSLISEHLTRAAIIFEEIGDPKGGRMVAETRTIVESSGKLPTLNLRQTSRTMAE